ncbi:MAG: FtsX-like permease family protein, partial [Kordiimonadaceae bacterium]|nr:FtsX-like permease family protein [Kordiimonadaceae bacterium]
MFKNYLTTAIRNMMRHKLYTMINIGGLAIGLAACILIFLFVKDELSFDDWGTSSDSIYRLEAAFQQNQGEYDFVAMSPGKLRDTFAENFSGEFDAVSRLYRNRHMLTRNGDVFQEEFWAADTQFFEIFDLNIEAGNGAEALKNMSSVILTRRMAEKYFGDAPAIGKTIEMTMRVDGAPASYQVGAVIADPPLNSHFEADIILAINRSDYIHPNGSNGLDDWTTYRSFYAHTYVKFKEGANIAALESGLDDFISRNAPGNFSVQLAYEPEEYFDFSFINIQDIYLKGPASGRIKAGGDLMTVYSFIAIALLILSISSINFINLSIAKSILRSKEISLRKVLGAARSDIIKQFLIETALVMLFALSIALAIVFLAIPAFNSIALTFISNDFIKDPLFQFGLFGLIIVVVIGAGFYPSLIASGYRPVDALRSHRVSGAYSGKLRNIFVVLQFSISIGLIVSATIIFQQTRYARALDLGYNTDNIMVLRGIGESQSSSQLDVLEARMLEHPDIASVSFSRAVPFDDRNGINDFYRLDVAPDEPFMIPTRYMDDQYFPTYDVAILHGRNFDENHQLDMTTTRKNDGTLIEVESAALLNIAAARELGFSNPGDALDMVLGWGHGPTSRTIRVIGILPDIKLKPATFQDEP